jgi:hypothetical protein
MMPATGTKPTAPAGPVGRYTVGLADAADEPGIRALLRVPMDGEIRVALEREPDSRLAAAIEGDRHHTMVVRAGGGRVVAMGSRAVRTVWLDGAPARLGYLSQLRRHPALEGIPTRVLRLGYATLADTRQPDELPYDLTSIVADNRPARRLLERGLPGIPPYRPLGELVTCMVPTRGVMALRPRRLPPVSPGGGRLLEVGACLARNLSRHQLAPVWNAHDIAGGARSRGLAAGDLLVVHGADHGPARGPGGYVRGCAAIWDQRAFKQTRVRGYSPGLGRVRPVLNPLLRLAGRPPLPPAGATVAMAYLSHVAVDGDDPETFLALVARARRIARARGVDWLVTGFVAGHPLLGPLLRAARPRTYRAILYAVGWAPDAPPPALDGRRLHVEVATL